MENETETILKEQVLKLPQEVTSFLSAENWTDTLEAIADSFGLTSDERTQFKNETVLVLAGLVHPDAYHETLGAVLGMNPTLKGVVTAVEKDVFAPIRPALMQFFNEEKDHYGGESALSQEPYQKNPEIPSPWELSKETGKELESPMQKSTSATAPLPKTAAAPPSTVVPNVPPANLPTEESLAWEPHVLISTSPAQPLPQTFIPLGENLTKISEETTVHPFEAVLKRAAEEHSGYTKNAPEATASEEALPVPQYGTLQFQTTSLPKAPITPIAPAPSTPAEPLAPNNEKGSVSYQNIPIPAPSQLRNDPYRETIE